VAEDGTRIDALQDLTVERSSTRIKSILEVEKAVHMDYTDQVQQPTDRILERIDAIIQELQELRQEVMTRDRPSEKNLAAQLYAAWGQGTWNEYDPHLDWQRFTP
jgi:hypothetical protein